MELTFRESLPAVYRALKDLSINLSDAWSASKELRLNILFTETNAGKPAVEGGVFSDSNVISDLQKMMQDAEWSGNSGTRQFQVGKDIFVCLAKTAEHAKASGARAAGLQIAALVQGLSQKFESVALVDSEKVDVLSVFQGFGSGLYECEGFKNEGKENAFLAGWKSLQVYSKELSSRELSTVKELLKAQMITRHLGDAPPNWLNPARFAAVSEELAQEFGFKCKVLGLDEIRKEKMDSLLCVAAGSVNEPKVIVIEIEGQSSRTAALVGKGLTFDAGGISLKPSAGMEEMKYDMCGGATVLGAACYLAATKPKNKVLAFIGAVENMPGGNAARPGDIVKSRSGKTIEVNNTDAEGRLVLIDVMDYALTTYKPDYMIDAATLTGACLVALGSVCAGLMTNHQDWIPRVYEISEATGEPVWQLPLREEYSKPMKGDFADLKNIPAASVKAGTVTAGAFLQEFVGGTPWMHFDIAGTAWTCAATGYPSKGASGYGVHLLADLASSL